MERLVLDDGEEVRVATQGRGPTVVLLHEWASSHRIWEPVARRLEPTFRVVRWDARGHAGQARRPGPPITIARLAEDFGALLRAYAADPPTVVAHSMAALIVWEFIRRHGCDALGRLVVVDMTPRPVTDESWHLGVFGDWPCDVDRAFVESMRADFAEAVVGFIRRGYERRQRDAGVAERMRNMLQSLEPGPLIEIWESIMAGDWRDVLPTITVPSLLLYGGESTFYSVETARYVQDSIPGAALQVYAGADHHPHLADPQRFADDLAAFARR